MLENCRPDLIILDFYTPSMDGMEFVDRLHAMGNTRSSVHGHLGQRP